MKYVKISGLLLSVAAAAVMAFAGAASATITSPAGTAYTGAISMTAPTVEFVTGGNVKCHSLIEGTVNSGGTTVTITTLDFTECGKDTFVVVKNGQMFIASDGTVTMSGTEYTKQIHKTVLGFPITTHCLLRMENTVIGKLTEGVDPAKMDAGTAIPSPETDSACTESAETVGTYTITKPAGAITID